MKTQSFRDRCWKVGLVSALAMGGAIITSENCAFAQSKIVPDDTLGDERSVVIPNFNGFPEEVITGGARREANLFHSFLEFNVSEGRGAYFFSPDADIQNILARVTGGKPSDILGTLGTFQSVDNVFVPSNANLFLMNPNGIVFGPKASLNVGGSFMATTASTIGFADQGSFSASTPNAPSVLTVNPSAFLFNQIAAQPINSIENKGLLSVPNGRSLLLAGGDVSLNGGNLTAASGRVELGGVAESGAIGLNVDGNDLSLNFPNQVARADVSLTNRAGVGVAAGGGGSIAVNARNLDISGGGSLSAGVLPDFGTVDSKAGDIEINATNSVKIEGETSAPSSITNLVGNLTLAGNLTGPLALGSAGDIIINTGSLKGIGSFVIGSATGGKGDAGSVIIDARDGDVSFSGGYGSGVSSIVGPSAKGNGADIAITARSLSLSNTTQLVTSTIGKGNAGDIRINASKSVSLSSGSAVSAFSRSQGDAGNIIIDAPEAIVSFDGFKKLDNDSFQYTGVSTSVESGKVFYNSSPLEFVGTGQGGDITVTAKSLSLTNGAQLRASTFGRGNAGNISVDVGDGTVAFDGGGRFNSGIQSNVESGAIGNAGTIDLKAGSFSMTDGAQVLTLVREAGRLPNGKTLSPGRGNGGTVNINASDITLDGSSFNQRDAEFPSGIFSSVNDGATGNGGNINIQADSLALSNNAVIDSTLRLGAIGKGGDINIINLQSLSMTNGAQLRSDTSGQGNAGNVIIDAPDATVSFDGVGTINLVSPDTGAIVPTPSISGIISTVNALPEFKGERQGGNVDITAESLSLTNGAQVNASTFGKGDAGNLTVRASDYIEMIGSAEAGLAQTGLYAQVGQGGGGDAKDMLIETEQLSLRDGAQVNASTFGKGDAGNLTVRASEIELVGSTGIAADGNEYPSALQVRVEPGAEGDAGNLNIIEAERLSVRDGARVAADTTSMGNAGSLLVQAKDSVEVVGTSAEFGTPSLLSTAVNEKAIGDGGDLTIKTGQLIVQDGAQVSAETLSQGVGGDIKVQSNSLLLTDSARITTLSTGPDDAGDISINLRDALQANNGEISASSVQAGGGKIDIIARDIRLSNDSPITTSVSNGKGGGGDIEIKSDTLVAFDDSDILANAEFGSGGNIRIDSPAFLAEGFRGATAVGRNPGDFAQFRGNGRVDVSASSKFGTSGTIAASDSSFLQNSLTPLSGSFVSPEQVVAGSCLARRNVEQGSFVVTGTGGLPRSPYEAISGRYNVTGVQPIQGSSSLDKSAAVVETTAWKKGDPIQEAQGMVVTADGRTIVGTAPQLVALAKAKSLLCESD